MPHRIINCHLLYLTKNNVIDIINSESYIVLELRVIVMNNVVENNDNIHYIGVVDENLRDGVCVQKIDANSSCSYNNLRHYHMYYEFTMIYEGSVVFDINSKAEPHDAGTIHLIRPKDHHTLITVGNFKYFVVKFGKSSVSPEIITLLENSNRLPVLRPSEELCDEFYNEFDRLNDVFDAADQNNSDIARLEVKLYLQLLLIHFLNALKMIQPGEEQAEKRDLIISKILDYTRDHYKEDITLTDVADYVGLSKNYLSSYFRSAMNMTYWNYLSQYRLDRAMSLISSTAEPVAQIAYACGFNSYNTFIKAFRERYGITPTEYRKHIR